MAISYDGILVQGLFPLTLPVDVPASTPTEAVHLILHIVVLGSHAINQPAFVSDQPDRTGGYQPCAISNHWSMLMASTTIYAGTRSDGVHTAAGVILYPLPSGSIIDVQYGTPSTPDEHSLGGNLNTGTILSPSVIWGCVRQIRGAIAPTPSGSASGSIPAASFPVFGHSPTRHLENGANVHTSSTELTDQTVGFGISTTQINCNPGITRGLTNDFIIAQAMMYTTDGTDPTPIQTWNLDDSAEYDGNGISGGVNWHWSGIFGVKAQSTPFDISTLWNGPTTGPAAGQHMSLNAVALEDGVGPGYCPPGGFPGIYTAVSGLQGGGGGAGAFDPNSMYAINHVRGRGGATGA